ncbi:hypothetical protein C0989_004574 [Termitomyces sp. Mn162]|nr:hypothetical protein C0989_004574 [Termitomyces sp. Mn162]
MSGQSSKRLHSSEPQESVKRPNQEQDSQPVPQLEKAQELFRRERKSKLYNKLLDLIRRRASPQESQACYSSIFKKLAQIIVGRDDIPVPPSASYLWTFLNLCNPNLEREEWEFLMEALIKYIKTEDEKKPTLQTPASKSEPAIKESVKTAWKTAYVGNAHELLKGAMNAMYSESFEKPYANFCAIIQGSGTGKSWLVDKLTDSVFMIPMVLRPTGDRSGALLWLISYVLLTSRSRLSTG